MTPTVLMAMTYRYQKKNKSQNHLVAKEIDTAIMKLKATFGVLKYLNDQTKWIK